MADEDIHLLRFMFYIACFTFYIFCSLRVLRPPYSSHRYHSRYEGKGNQKLKLAESLLRQRRHQPPDQVRGEWAGQGLVELVDDGVESFRIREAVALTDVSTEHHPKPLADFRFNDRWAAFGFTEFG